MCIRDRDRDVARTLAAVADDPDRLQQLQDASQAMQGALRGGHRIYFYGTGSTGRLAETLESGSVSYTHLDVYKRQAPGRTMPPAAGQGVWPAGRCCCATRDQPRWDW